MLELLEELDPTVKKVFQKHVHMHELTSMSINGTKGQAIALTNRYLYLIFKGFFKANCYKISPDELVDVKVDVDTLVLKTQGKEHRLNLPKKKKHLLGKIKKRLHSFRLEDEKLTGNS